MIAGDGRYSRLETLQGAGLDAALTELCERRQGLFLATPYLSFESRFLERAGAAIRIRATMSHNVVRSTLSQPPLRLRVLWNLARYGGATRILEYETAGDTKTLLLAAPSVLAPDEQRRAYRLEQVGRSTGTLGSQELALVRVTLETINQWGIGVFCVDPLPPSGFQAGRMVRVALALEQGPAVQATARVCHASGPYLGLVFTPPLEGTALDALSPWLLPRLAEAQRLWKDRANLRVLMELAARPKAAPDGVLLVCGDGSFPPKVAAALGPQPALRFVYPAMAPFREAMTCQPPQVLLLVLTGGLEESHRLRTMLENVPIRCPVVALGAGPDQEQTRALAAELRATLFLEQSSVLTPFFPRLMLGLIRKHWPAAAGPPPEPAG